MQLVVLPLVFSITHSSICPPPIQLIDTSQHFNPKQRRSPSCAHLPDEYVGSIWEVSRCAGHKANSGKIRQIQLTRFNKTESPPGACQLSALFALFPFPAKMDGWEFTWVVLHLWTGGSLAYDINCLLHDVSVGSTFCIDKMRDLRDLQSIGTAIRKI